MSTPIIEVAELAERMAQGDGIVLADCRFDPSNPEAGAAAYHQAHLPGAHYLHLDRDLAGPSGVTGGRHPVPSPEDFGSMMRRIGVSADTQLVAYDGGGLAMASRMWWLARYYGHEHVAVLNGGMAAWQAADLPLETGPAISKPGNFTATPDWSMRADFEELSYPESRPLVVDARDPSRFAGLAEPGGAPAGHIPGAINKFYQEVIGTDGRLLEAGALRDHWSWLEEEESAPIVSCGSGITACVNLLSMEVAGVEGARLYPGSWSDWCQRGGEVATGGQ